MYGIDLRDALWGPESIGARRLLSLTRWLPTGGAVAKETENSWTQQDELLATIIELIGHTSQMQIRFPRPWDEEEQEDGKARAQSSLDEVRAFVGTMAEDPMRVVIG